MKPTRMFLAAITSCWPFVAACTVISVARSCSAMQLHLLGKLTGYLIGTTLRVLHPAPCTRTFIKLHNDVHHLHRENCWAGVHLLSSVARGSGTVAQSVLIAACISKLNPGLTLHSDTSDGDIHLASHVGYKTQSNDRSLSTLEEGKRCCPPQSSRISEMFAGLRVPGQRPQTALGAELESTLATAHSLDGAATVSRRHPGDNNAAAELQEPALSWKGLHAYTDGQF